MTLAKPHGTTACEATFTGRFKIRGVQPIGAHIFRPFYSTLRRDDVRNLSLCADSDLEGLDHAKRCLFGAAAAGRLSAAGPVAPLVAPATSAGPGSLLGVGDLESCAVLLESLRLGATSASGTCAARCVALMPSCSKASA
eukprot:CAMPEP_0183535930 /NCGR_PEP_ID=MMETSP0371-20130417/27881_1 /TAXON_ID=268820 /ORGANISM="Peridinium aciculiferum, Strain PAER-2" /LENGTH=139 /DNA_ID=CAMNT_0025736457 /DNA_START=10 /DNA_END=426 /DNA_ORIENTATION=-